jgi:hypothetical protein
VVWSRVQLQGFGRDLHFVVDFFLTVVSIFGLIQKWTEKDQGVNPSADVRCGCAKMNRTRLRLKHDSFWPLRLHSRPRRRWIQGPDWCMCIGLVAHTPVEKTTDHGPRTIYRSAGFFQGRMGLVILVFLLYCPSVRLHTFALRTPCPMLLAPCGERSEPGRRILQGRVGFLHTLSSRTRESIDQCYLLLNFFLNFLSSLTAPEPCEAGWHRSGSPVWSDRESGMRGYGFTNRLHARSENLSSKNAMRHAPCGERSEPSTMRRAERATRDREGGMRGAWNVQRLTWNQGM